MSRDEERLAALCVIRAERQAPGRHLFTVSILPDVGASTPPWQTRTVAHHEVVRLIQAFLDDAAGTDEDRGDDNRRTTAVRG